MARFFGILRDKMFSGGKPSRLDSALGEAFEAAGNDLAREQSRGLLRTSQAGIDIIHSFESCAIVRADGMVQSYPDPGSVNGEPWTIGWGSTGPDIGPSTVWTRAQCDERFEGDLRRFEDDVREAIGSTPTTQNQFDAMVSFHYNTGAIKRATLTKKHNLGLYRQAANQFSRWVYNDGNKMNGLVRRRKAEAKLYLK